MPSANDTYNKLRRVTYPQAAAIYCIACMHLPSDTPREILNATAKEDLRVAGWTIEDLTKESVRIERDEHGQNNN